MLACPKFGWLGVHADAERTNTMVVPSGDQSGNIAVPVVVMSVTSAPVTASRTDSLPLYADTICLPSGLNDEVASIVLAAACCAVGLVASTPPTDMVVPAAAPVRPS